MKMICEMIQDLTDKSIPIGGRIALGMILLSMAMVPIILFVIVPLAVIQDRKIAERDYAICQSRGLDMTNLIQGYGKYVTSKHLCVAKDGTLYAL